MRQTLLYAFMALMGITGCSGHLEFRILVGTYGEAIHELVYDSYQGVFNEVSAIQAHNASYLALEGNTLYAVSESGAQSGAYSFTKEGGKWERTGFVQGNGDDPCYILPVKGSVLTADYTGGALSQFNTDGAAAISSLHYSKIFPSIYNGDGPVKGRQNSAHIHQVKRLENTGLILVSDLGNDCIHLCQEDNLDIVKDIPCGEGAGPRHMEYNGDTRILYCLTELSGEVIVWKREGDEFRQLQRIKVDEVDAAGSADIHLSTDGRFLYTSHRLQNDGISVLKVLSDGRLEKIGYRHTGLHPRNFIITPDGSQMIVACRDSHSLEVYDIDSQTGLLSEMRCNYVFDTDSPVCVIFEKPVMGQ